jgi:hypothetical protein
MDFSSTETEQLHSFICVIYDPKDGRLVHGHEFIGDGTGLFGPDGQAERERLTLEGAKRRHKGKLLARFKVLHLPKEMRFEEGLLYRVDTKSKRIVPRDSKPGVRKKTRGKKH